VSSGTTRRYTLKYSNRYGRLSVPTRSRRSSLKTTHGNGLPGRSVLFPPLLCSLLSFRTIQWKASARTVSRKKRRTTPSTTHPPWTSISIRSLSGGRSRRPSTPHNEAIFASSHLPFSADKAYTRTTSTSPLARQITLIHVSSMVVVGYFSFKANPMSTVTTVVDERTGEEKERLINKGRWKGFGPTSITFSEKAVGQYFFLPISRLEIGCVRSPNL
jgi:hypothetical protein